jgi:DNA-binding transcriptional ArsR family regulator
MKGYEDGCEFKTKIMGVTKSDQFSERENEIAGLLKALAHPARIAIVEYLLSVDSCICGDIVDHLPLAQSTVSQHLKELKSAGIIQGSVEGTSICYCIDEKAMGKLKSYFGKLESKLKSKCC